MLSVGLCARDGIDDERRRRSMMSRRRKFRSSNADALAPILSLNGVGWGVEG